MHASQFPAFVTQLKEVRAIPRPCQSDFFGKLVGRRRSFNTSNRLRSTPSSICTLLPSTPRRYGGLHLTPDGLRALAYARTPHLAECLGVLQWLTHALKAVSVDWNKVCVSRTFALHSTGRVRGGSLYSDVRSCSQTRSHGCARASTKRSAWPQVGIASHVACCILRAAR